MRMFQAITLLLLLLFSTVLALESIDFVNIAHNKIQQSKSDSLLIFHVNHSSNSQLRHINQDTTRQHSTKIRIDDCYPWMLWNKTSGECECSDIPNRAVLCDPTIPRTSILECYCMTYDSERNETELGRCLLGCGHKEDSAYDTLPQNKSDLNDYTCGKASRDSTLCGKCKPGYSPLVYSYELKCMNCTGLTYNWIKYIAVAYIPLTCFFLIVVIFKFSGTHPLVRGYISICQGLVSPIGMRAYLSIALNKPYLEPSVRVLGSIYGIWNLDFFRTVIPHICLNINPLQALMLDYATAFYPLVLVVITYTLICLHDRDIRIVVWLWKPFHKLFHSLKNDWEFEGSVIKAFATFFLLSYLKISNVSMDLLVYTEKYTLSMGEDTYQAKPALYYDPSVEYFHGEHLYYGIAAILVGTFIVILPLVFLVIYPMRLTQKCLNHIKVQRQSIDMFVNCYQGYYKDGTNGTKDCRIFSTVFFLLQIILFALFIFSKSMYFFPAAAMVILFIVFITLAVQPYKEQFKVYSLIDSFMLLVLASIYIMFTAGDVANVKAHNFSAGTYFVAGILGVIPFIYFIALSIWWISMKTKLKQRLPCFRTVELPQPEEQSDTNELPDRIEHPSIYQTAPLLPIQ